MSHKLTALIFVLLSALDANAQAVEMADVMRSNGKIFVVVAVAATVMAGIIGFMVYLDMRIRKMEKAQNSKQNTK